MISKDEINQTIKTQFGSMRERGHVLVLALKARAKIAATNRRMRSAFTDLGETVYKRMGEFKPLGNDAALSAFKTRLEGLEAELEQREKSLRDILKPESKATEVKDEVEVHAAGKEAGKEK